MKWVLPRFILIKGKALEYKEIHGVYPTHARGMVPPPGVSTQFTVTPAVCFLSMGRGYTTRPNILTPQKSGLGGVY